MVVSYPDSMTLTGEGDHAPTNEQLRFVLNVAFWAVQRTGVNRDQADDVAQLTAIKLVERWDSMSVRTARQSTERYWRNYIALTARRTYLDILRSENRRWGREQKAVGGAQSFDRADPGGWLPGFDGNDVEAHLARSLIEDGIAQLPAELQAVAWLAFVKDRPTSEIASQLGITKQKARKIRLRAQRLLAEFLSDEA